MSNTAFISGAKTVEGRLVDLLIRNGRISSVKEHEAERAVPGDAKRIDAAGYVILPPFTDSHTHLDKTMLGMEWAVNDLPPYLPAWVKNERENRDALGIDPYRQACRLVEKELSFGTIGIRSHADVDLEHGLSLLEGVLRAREEYRDRAHIEVVAFPQSGLLSRPGTYELMRQALAMGADLAGGLDPAAIDRDPKAGVDAIFRLAEEAGKPVDIHLHEPGHLGAFTLSLICERTRAAGMEGRVTVSHAFCLGYPDPELAEPLIGKLLEAKISVVTAGQAYIRYVPSVQRLTEAGVLVCGANDNVRDLWSPYGTGDMLERAMLIAMRNGMRRDDLLKTVLRVCTENGAKLMGLDNYGISEGCDASFVLVRAQNAAQCVARAPKERMVFNHGDLYQSESR